MYTLITDSLILLAIWCFGAYIIPLPFKIADYLNKIKKY